MTRNHEVHKLTSKDRAHLLALRQRIPDAFGPPCSECEQPGNACYIALEGDEPAACLLCFVRGRDAYCSTIAVRADLARAGAVSDLLGRFCEDVLGRIDTCWISVSEDHPAARALRKMLGAAGIGVRIVYTGPHESHITARIDRARAEQSWPTTGLRCAPTPAPVG